MPLLQSQVERLRRLLLEHADRFTTEIVRQYGAVSVSRSTEETQDRIVLVYTIYK